MQTKQADLDECVQQETKLKMADEEDESERKSPVPLGWRKLGMHERIIVSEEEIGPDEVSAGCDGNARYPEPESPKIHVLHNSFQGPHDSNKDTSVVHWCDKTSDRLGGNSSCPPSPPPAIATEVSTKLADKSRHRRATAASLNNDFASSPPDMLLPLLANNTGSSSGGSASNQTATTSATTPATELDLDELCGRFEKLRLDGMKEVAKRGTAGQGKAGGKEEEGKEARDVEATVRALKMFLEKLKPDVIQSGGDGEMKEQVWKLLAGVAKTALEILAAGKAVG